MLHVCLALFALAAITLTAAGCGSSSKATATSTQKTTAAVPTTTSTGTTSVPEPTAASVPPVTVTIASGKPLSRAQWIAKGDAICSRLNEELASTRVKFARELVRVLPQAAAYERAELAQLAKLVPPPSRATDWQQFLNATGRWAAGSAKLAEYANLGGGLTKSPLAVAMIEVHENLVALARHDGFKACALTS